MLDGIGALQITCNHLETLFFVLDGLEKSLNLVHFVVQATTLVLSVLVQLGFKVLLLVISLLSTLFTTQSKLFL